MILSRFLALEKKQNIAERASQRCFLGCLCISKASKEHLLEGLGMHFCLNIHSWKGSKSGFYIVLAPKHIEYCFMSLFGMCSRLWQILQKWFGKQNRQKASTYVICWFFDGVSSGNIGEHCCIIAKTVMTSTSLLLLEACFKMFNSQQSKT